MDKLIIDRSKWACGNHSDGLTPKLLDLNGKRCCLGHLGKFCGLSDKSALGNFYPSSYNVRYYAKWPDELFENPHVIGYDRWESVFAIINDTQYVSGGFLELEDDRESWIKEGFKQLFNIDLEFAGEY